MATDQNKDDCRSSVLGLRARLAVALVSDPEVGPAAAATICSALNGLSRSGASFATRLTAVEISQASISASGAGVSTAAAISASTFAQSSQKSNASGGTITGMR